VSGKTRELAHVDALLEQWARWGKQGSGLGFPAITLLGKVMEQGFAGAAQPGPVPEMDETVQITERAVLRLKEIRRRVIVKHYLYWQPIEVSARYCHMSPGRFRTILHDARRQIADYVDGYYDSNNGRLISAA
jgi:DNA-directed RNA polymerase specialized sigma24 family protein